MSRKCFKCIRHLISGFEVGLDCVFNIQCHSGVGCRMDPGCCRRQIPGLLQYLAFCQSLACDISLLSKRPAMTAFHHLPKAGMQQYALQLTFTLGPKQASQVHMKTPPTTASSCLCWLREPTLMKAWRAEVTWSHS
jgi:hypothetical protein